jgi:hypothetical protein
LPLNLLWRAESAGKIATATLVARGFRAMAETFPSPADDLIERDWSCANCGYNLRTQPRAGRCPECNWPIGFTLAAPPGGNAHLIVLACAAGVVPWFLARPLAFMVPIREGAGTVAILFGASALVLFLLLRALRRYRRDWGRYHFGRSGLAAMVLSACFAVANLGIGSFWTYLARDTTVYAPGFNQRAFFAIHPGTTRETVERQIGPPLRTWTEKSGERSYARYSQRSGYLGYTHLVVYDAQGRVISIARTRTAD